MGLDRQQVVDAALDLLDEIGLDALTMRKVADRLGVRLNTVYWHVSGKPQLLEAMADRMLLGCTDEPLPEPWADRLRELAHRYRRALLARRDGARVVAGTYPAEPCTFRLADAMTATLLDAGIEPRAAAWSVWAIAYYTLGLTQEEQAAAVPGLADRVGAAITPDRYPALAATMPHLLPADFGQRFDFGLDLMLATLADKHGIRR
ncbi:TetR/AcrR family transcriptional regulator C-terminal domain-containing protein [Nocardia terpenica]|uniref:TetR family transcriptional regulator n=1 Tax=Nocardia terpenica TaxID=455432 RepID=A0A6G9ZC34_9NOCA|nr:TetR/AcrR family transcriptional regulator C-terminal domain-containing protein [Nocardia terpenica]QIS22917.1 TetR family transcriptional regulator [Nocardia terpenica]